MRTNIHLSLSRSWIVLLAAIIFHLASCEGKKKSIDTSANITPEVIHDVIIYGSESCDHCIEFRQQMDSAKFAYEFKDAEASPQYYQELLQKIQQANFTDYVSFPVLDIDGKLYVKPDFAEVVTILRK